MAGALYADPDTLPGVPSKFDQDSESWSVFSQGTWNYTDTLRFTLGVRYSDETKDLDKVTVSDGLQIRLGDNILFANPLNKQLIADVRQH